MKRTMKAGFVLLGVLVCASLLWAQEGTRTSSREASKKIPDLQLSDDLAGAGAADTSPVPGLTGIPDTTNPTYTEIQDAVRVVARFLKLNSTQVTQLQQLLQTRQQTIGPLLQQIAQREQQLRTLLESGGTPSDIGQLTIEIYQLGLLVQRAQQDFLAAFEMMLSDSQLQAWKAVRLADQLQPLLPAFKLLRLI